MKNETDIISGNTPVPANTHESEAKEAEPFERKPEPSVRVLGDSQLFRLLEHIAILDELEDK